MDGEKIRAWKFWYSRIRNLKKNKKQFLDLRSIEPSSLSPEFRAARFIYLNRFCFNGLYRTNRQGKFNVPYSGNKTGKIPSTEQFQDCSSLLAKATLLSANFEETLLRVREGDFVYLDPPFAVKAKRIFNEYDASYFDQDSIKRLRNWLVSLDSKRISFLVSYADSDEARFLSQGFMTHSVTVKRNIAGFASDRRIDTELLIFN